MTNCHTFWEELPLVIQEADGSLTPLAPGGNIAELKLLGASFGTTDPDGQNWNILVQTPSGLQPISSLPASVRAAALKTQNDWNAYVLEHKNNSIQIEEIFQIDLNSLISLDVELEMMYHTTVSAK